MNTTADTEVKDDETREELAKGFVKAFKQAIKLAERKMAGEVLENDFEQHIKQLQAEAEKMRLEDMEGVKNAN